MLLQANLAAAVPPWAWLLLLLVGAFGAGWLAQRILIRSLRSITRRTQSRIDDLILNAIAPSLTLAFFAAGMWIGLQYLPVTFSPITLLIVNNVAATLFILAVAIAAARLLGGLLEVPARREPRWQPAVAVGKRILNVVVYSVALMMVLDHLDQPITPLIASLGIAALAVALALQDTLTNFFAGVWIQAGRTLQPGHLVEFENPKVMGFVREVGWRTTKIQTLPNNIVVIPNKTVAEATVTDYDLPDPRMGTNLTVRVGFEADPDQVERILLESVLAVAQGQPELGILEDPPPATRLDNFGEYGYEFWLGFQCKSWLAQWNGGGAIRKEIARRFRDAGIRIPSREPSNVASDRVGLGKGLAGAASMRRTAAETGGSGAAEASRAES